MNKKMYLRASVTGKSFLNILNRLQKRYDAVIHLNPVRAKMVKTPEEYEWSSYQFYIGKKKPPEWLHRDFILQYFGNKVSIAQKEYRSFVNAILNKKHDNPLDEVVSSTLLGSPGFIKPVKKSISVTGSSGV